MVSVRTVGNIMKPISEISDQINLIFWGQSFFYLFSTLTFEELIFQLSGSNYYFNLFFILFIKENLLLIIYPILFLTYKIFKLEMTMNEFILLNNINYNIIFSGSRSQYGPVSWGGRGRKWLFSAPGGASSGFSRPGRPRSPDGAHLLPAGGVAQTIL